MQARVWFDGTTLGSASKTFNSATNSIIKSGTVVWDGSSSTLTLNNVLIEVPEPSENVYSSLILNEDISGMIIQVSGACTITTKAHSVLSSSKQVYFRGSNTATRLTIKDERTSDRGMLYRGAINVTDGYIYFNRIDCNITSSNGVCVYVWRQHRSQQHDLSEHLFP